MTPDRLHPRLVQAQQFHQAGRLEQAADLYRQILAYDPSHADAHHLLGLVYSQQGAAEQAIAHLRQAIAIDGSDPTYHNNLGEALRRAGRPGEAEASYRQALALQPALAEAHFNLAGVLRGLGRLQAAADHYRQAIDARPDYLRAHQNLGSTLQAAGQLQAAAVAYQHATRLRPEDGDLHFQLGLVFSQLGQLDAALHHYRQAARLQPESAEVRNNLGTAVQASGRLEEAVGHFQAAIGLNPRLANIHRNLGLAEKLRGRVDEARTAFRESLALEPDDSLLSLEADTIAPFILASNAAIDRYRSGLDATLDRYLDAPFPIDLTQLHVGEACPPYVLVYQGRDDRALKEKWARLFDGRLPSGDPRPGTDKPHLGFVVTHTHEGVFARSLTGILNRLPPGRFQVTIVCNRAAVAQFLRSTLDNPAIRFLVIPARLDQAADLIRQARFDLLYYFEIGTDPTNYFLPFFRLAPVQCNSWGWQVTSGIPQVDTYLSSRLLEPPGAADHYSETLVLLDTLLTCYERPPVPDTAPAHSRYGFRDDQHIYCCAQSLLKVHPDFDPLAAELLRRDPAGVLVFVGLDDPHPTALVRARMRHTLPDVVDRVHFLPRQTEPGFLGLLSLADVVLDTPHYGGVNTTYQALAAGTPIVTWPGAFQRGRYTFGAYRKMGLLDLIADSAASYVEKALSLGTDKGYRQQMSGQILEASPVLFEDHRAAEELADYFEEAVTQARSRYVATGRLIGNPAGGIGLAGSRRDDREPGGDRVVAEPSRLSIAFLDPSTQDYAVDTPYRQPLGGTQSAVCYLAEQLARRGDRVYLLSRNTRPRVTHDVTCLAWRDDQAALVDLLGWLAVDVAVAVNAAHQPELAPLRQRTRLVMWTQHAADQPAMTDLDSPAFRDAQDAFVFASAWQRDQFISRFGLDPSRCTVLANAIAPAFEDLFEAGESILDAKRQPTLAYTSAPYRGLDLLLDVFPAIRAEVPRARLEIFSSMKTYQRNDADGLYRPLYDRAITMPGVNYMGGLPQAELARALKHTAALAYPNSFPETFCISALEAMAAGCQVVTSDLGALPDTTAGFARLVSLEDGQEAYRAAFVQNVVEALRAAADAGTSASAPTGTDPDVDSGTDLESGLRRQVAYVNEHARWEDRAAEWAEWMEELVGAG